MYNTTACKIFSKNESELAKNQLILHTYTRPLISINQKIFKLQQTTDDIKIRVGELEMNTGSA